MKSCVAARAGLLVGASLCFFVTPRFAPAQNPVFDRRPAAETPAVAPSNALPAGKEETPKEEGVIETPALSPELQAEADAIRQAEAEWVKAYRHGDAQAVAALFTEDGEYINEDGQVFHGRAAIAAAMTAFFADNPHCHLHLRVDDIRFLAPGVAVEEGLAAVRTADEEDAAVTSYTAVHVKTQGRWLAASIRDRAPEGREDHRAHLQQLDWLIGDWVDEGEDMQVTFSCEPVDDGNYLLRKFTVQIGGRETMSGVQRIGWDPLTKKLRAWTFDSKGGFAEGTWHTDGQRWWLTSAGVTAHGQHATGTLVYTPVRDNAMTWQMVNHEVGGEQRPDLDPITIVRRAPHPDSLSRAADKPQ